MRQPAGPTAPAAGAETALNAKTSWIGNTFGFGDGTWTQINITALAVTPDGKVYTDAPWDESGAGNEKGHLVSPGIWPEKGRQ
jgi:hypothetical protein